MAKNYSEKHFLNWEIQPFPTKKMNFKSASGKMPSVGTIIKEMIIGHIEVNTRLNPDYLVLEDAHIQGFLLRTDYQRIYGIYIYSSKAGHITIGTKEKEFSLDIYQFRSQDPLEDLLNGFKQGKFSFNLTSKKTSVYL
ncbi:hypothetical protein O181_070782 [Austropuccinia psidii MF-1]|uniref:Uncharacterized protein n=1 Tax=Austropuccinia psidii MF-1 TaxID=1389203 RepID=A0A9Q3F3X3_9BASI|nr:hypothetical protein [Austropuccinia psidii MF-1]